jgi:hypothetical protein
MARKKRRSKPKRRPAPKKPDILPLIGIPLERQVPGSVFQNFLQIARHGWNFIDPVYRRTDVSRNIFGRTLLEHKGFTHLVMLDLDHWHPFDIVQRLLAPAVHDRDKYQVVGALAFRRGEPFNPCAYQLDPDGELQVIIDWTPGLLKVDAIGHGAMAIDRRVLEKLPAPWWQYEYWEWEMSDDYNYPTEDLYFSELCRDHGVNIWCDTRIRTPHLAETAIDEGVFRRFQEANPPKRMIENGVVKPYDPAGLSGNGQEQPEEALEPEKEQA